MTAPFIKLREAMGTEKAQDNRARDGKKPDSSKAAIELVTISLDEFVKLDLPTREMVLAPIIPERGLAMLYAGRGVGKTHVAMGIAYAVACGGTFLRYRAHKPRRVLYVDGEMPAALLQERAKNMMAASPYQPPDKDYFRLLAMDRQELGTSVNLALPEHQEALERHLDGVEFLVLDNVSTLVNGGPENDASSWDAMQAWLLMLRRKGVSVLIVHHAGRGDNARGTSKREDTLDTVVHLKRPEDYEPEQGARFEVHLTKARGVFGEDAMPFEAKLIVENGKDYWRCETLRDREVEDVERLSHDGMSVRDIAEELGRSKSKVNRIQVKLRSEGRVP